MNPAVGRWVILFLRSSLTIAVEPDSPGRELIAAGLRYAPAYVGDPIATYDRLTMPDARLVGFQVWPVAGCADGIFDALPQYPYLRVHGKSYFDILLAPAVAEGGFVSAGDQSLIGQIYRSDSGEIAVAIDLAELALTEEDLTMITLAGKGRTV